MKYSKHLYEVDNTGEAIENRFSYDMIVNSINNNSIKKEDKPKKCLPCGVELNETNTHYTFLCNECFKLEMNKIKRNK